MFQRIHCPIFFQVICTEEWPAEWEWSRPIYGAFINISQFVLPFTTILFCYRLGELTYLG